MSPLVRSIIVLVMLWLAAPGTLASRSVPLFPLSSPDAFGRITTESQPNALVQATGVARGAGSISGYNWSAIYDAMGRRLRTVHAVVTAGVAGANTTTDSFYDPQVEFGEIGVALNGARTWKVMGPDLGGAYGSWQGVGGLEATVRESDLQVTPVVADHFGNVVARVSGGQVLWSSNHVDGYGPLLGGAMPRISDSVSLAEASVWRGKRMDPTGFYWLGARHYEPVSGRFLSPDPAGHEGSYDLYSFANGDPVNSFDPDGRLGKAALDRTMEWGVNKWRDGVSTYNGLMSSETRGQTLTDFIYGENVGAFNWMVDSARSAGSLAVGGQFTSYFNNQALDYLSGQGTDFINDMGCVLGADPNSGAARTGEFWSQAALTTGSLFAGQGELKIVSGAERGVLAAESGLSTGRQVGWVNPIPKYDVNAPWYRYTTPSFGIDAGVVTEGRTAAQIAATKAHEGQHIMDVVAHPQITHLATQKGFFPGSGISRYWLEYRGYSAGGQLQGLGTPFQSFNTLQKVNFGMDALIFGGGTAGAIYMNSGN